MRNWDIAIDIFKSLFPNLDVFDQYNVDFNLYEILIEPKEKLLGHSMFCKVKLDGKYVSAKSVKDIVCNLIEAYKELENVQLKIIRKYAKHKAMEKRRNNGN